MNDTTENKKNIFYTAMLILTLIITIIGTAYAFSIMMKSQEEGSSAIYTGTLSIEYLTGRIIDCHLMPIYTPADVHNEDAYTNTFSIKSTGTLNAVVNISLDINYNEFPDDYIRYALYNENEELLQMGNLNGEESNTLMENVLIKTNEEATYTLQIWLEEINEDQSEYMRKNIVGTINVDAIQDKNIQIEKEEIEIE